MVGASKLTSDDVKKIKELLSLGVKISEISKNFKVSTSHITNIKNGLRWNDNKKSFIMKDDIPENIKNIIVETLSQGKGGSTSTKDIKSITRDLINEIEDNKSQYVLNLDDNKKIIIKIEIC